MLIMMPKCDIKHVVKLEINGGLVLHWPFLFFTFFFNGNQGHFTQYVKPHSSSCPSVKPFPLFTKHDSSKPHISEQLTQKVLSPTPQVSVLRERCVCKRACACACVCAHTNLPHPEPHNNGPVLQSGWSTTAYTLLTQTHTECNEQWPHLSRAIIQS